ncbi:sodium-dependent bicarbonate transport family permease [Fulvivirga sp. RKSG066]|uniref:sodium-dependent bicarbonate transport family permease n=1 Tax=Fulvivirga aurantia TaxID=2529383 RepID=UPI0012BD0A30|nr:sodium-dependent bicarbonate transport family permease [Fulvivirga aurantia]MTI20910.1 sodium-dependent bicarbonate transport family permease [Fulvivirga aurantia]
MNGLTDNLTNPALLFFLLGIFAAQIKSDLKIPESSSKFISVYLLLSIGFKGGQELAHSVIGGEIVWSMLLGIFMALLVPLYTFFILKRKLSIENAGAIAAAYGSVSAVTFVTAISFLDFEQVGYNGHMIAVMALMEAPAIIVGVLLINMYGRKLKKSSSPMLPILKHSVSNASVLLILSSMVIGFLASEEQAQGIKPFTTDIFKGFLAVFLLDMGITAGRHIHSMFKNGMYVLLFSCLIPFINGLLALYLASFVTDSPGNILLFALLGASASYIAVPAAMKNAVPAANPGLYLPMALGITFPINIIIGIPFYFIIIQNLI